MRNTILTVLILLSGCMAGTPNNIQRSVSTFDGAVEYRMDPGFVHRDAGALSGADFKLGLLWNTAMGERILISAAVPGHILSIAARDGLQLNINGEIISLQSDQVFTRTDIASAQRVVFTESERYFAADIDLIARMIEAESVKVRLNTGEGFMEGDFLVDRPSAAIRGFRSMLSQIREE